MPLIFILLVSQNTVQSLAVSVMSLISTWRSWCELDGSNARCCPALKVSAHGEGHAKADLRINLLDVQI